MLQLPSIDANLLFEHDVLVDTGTNRTLIMPSAYEAVGLTWSDFAGADTTSTTGVGGSAEIRIVEGALILIDEEESRFFRYRSLINIAPPTAQLQTLPPLLGRDVTDHFRPIIDRTNDLISLDDPEKYR